ncbi:MAG TPA: hypothetical protein VGN14_06455 [Candidatus Elarobacter sp.]|jgi:hypothetical protein
MKRLLSSLAAAALIAAVPLAASAAISPGTVLVGNMDQSINSGNAVVGQSFTMHGVHSQDYNINNAVLYGHVCDVQRASQGRSASIQLCFDKLHTASGGSYALDGRAINVQQTTKSNVVNEAAGALGGMIVGNILGKQIGTNLGGLAGAAGGYIYAKNARQQITIPQNAVVSVQVLRAVRQAGR